MSDCHQLAQKRSKLCHCSFLHKLLAEGVTGVCWPLLISYNPSHHSSQYQKGDLLHMLPKIIIQKSPASEKSWQGMLSPKVGYPIMVLPPISWALLIKPNKIASMSTPLWRPFSKRTEIQCRSTTAWNQVLENKSAWSDQWQVSLNSAPQWGIF